MVRNANVNNSTIRNHSYFGPHEWQMNKSTKQRTSKAAKISAHLELYPVL